jgi:hypothetical protein
VGGSREMWLMYRSTARSLQECLDLLLCRSSSWEFTPCETSISPPKRFTRYDFSSRMTNSLGCRLYQDKHQEGVDIVCLEQHSIFSGHLRRLRKNSAEPSQSAKHDAPPSLNLEGVRVTMYDAETFGAPCKLPLRCSGHTPRPSVTRQEECLI